MDQPRLRLSHVQIQSRSLMPPNRTISGHTPTRLCSRVAARRPPVDLRSLSQSTRPRSSLHRSRPWHRLLRRQLHQEETSLPRPSHKSSEPTRPTTTTFGTCRSMCLARIRTMRKILRNRDRNLIIVKCFISSHPQCILWTIQCCQERTLHRSCTNTRP